MASNMDRTRITQVNTDICERQAIPVSHKTLTVLLIVKVGKSCVDDRGYKQPT